MVHRTVAAGRTGRIASRGHDTRAPARAHQARGENGERHRKRQIDAMAEHSPGSPAGWPDPATKIPSQPGQQQRSTRMPIERVHVSIQCRRVVSDRERARHQPHGVDRATAQAARARRARSEATESLSVEPLRPRVEAEGCVAASNSQGRAAHAPHESGRQRIPATTVRDVRPRLRLLAWRSSAAASPDRAQPRCVRGLCGRASRMVGARTSEGRRYRRPHRGFRRVTIDLSLVMRGGPDRAQPERRLLIRARGPRPSCVVRESRSCVQAQAVSWSKRNSSPESSNSSTRLRLLCGIMYHRHDRTRGANRAHFYRTIERRHTRRHAPRFDQVP